MPTLPSAGVYPKGKLDLSRVLEDIRLVLSDGRVGALATFTGLVKAQGKDDRPVKKLVVESYDEHANASIQKVCEEVRARHGVLFVGIYHLTGTFIVGDPLVLVAVGSGHRKEAFSALDEAVDRYKTEPALWKKEVYSDGSSVWISHEPI